MQSALSRIPNRVALAALMLLSVACWTRAQGAGAYAITKTLKVGGPGSWDYVTVDPQSQRLYLTRTTHTMVLDAASGNVIADIPGQKRSHGVALVPKLGRGFITDGEDGSVVIFDLKTNKVLGKLAAADDADGIIYDPASDRVLVACGDAGLLLSIAPDIDPNSGKPQQIELGGKPEFLAADGAGKAFVNLADKAMVAEVDLKSNKVIGRWPVAPAAEPVGLAIDPAGGHLFVGCRSRNLIVMSTSDGHILANLPIGATNDACAFDSGTGDIFASCGDGTLTIARETSSGKFTIIQQLQTRRGAKTMGSLHPRRLPAGGRVHRGAAGRAWPPGGQTGFLHGPGRNAARALNFCDSRKKLFSCQCLCNRSCTVGSDQASPCVTPPPARIAGGFLLAAAWVQSAGEGEAPAEPKLAAATKHGSAGASPSRVPG